MKPGKTALLLYFTLTTGIFFGCKKNDDDGIFTVTELNDALEKEFDKQGMTSLAYAVVKNDAKLLVTAMGKADVAKDIDATDETRYLIASVSKTVTAVALMQLYEDSLFSLDQDINHFLPFPVRNPDYPDDSITFRMLLSHTSGISDEHQNTLDLYCWGSDCAMSLEDYCSRVFINDNRDFYSEDNFSGYAPGENEEYSNLGMALAGYLVEKISGKLFYNYCEDSIFDVLGMSQTEWRLSKTPVAELAIPYSPDITSASPHYTFPDYPNGGLRTSVYDMSKFLRAFIMNGKLDDNILLQPSTVSLMRTLQFGSQDQCLGFYYDYFDGVQVMGHNGSEMGVSTEMYFNPANNVGVIVFNNDDDTDLRKVVSLLLDYGADN